MILHLLLALVGNLLRAPLAPFRALRRAHACPKGAWVHLDVAGPIVDMARPAAWAPWRRGPNGVLSLHQVRELVDEMLRDERPAGLLVTLRPLAASAAHRTALRAELARLVEAGHPVVAHLPVGGGAGELMVASVAQRVLLGAHCTLGPLGFHVGALYLREGLELAGVVPERFSEGAYKTAGETLARSTMSEPQREQLGRVLDVVQGEFVAALAAGRGVEASRVEQWVDRGLLGADEAVDEGLADLAVHDDEIANVLDGTRASEPVRTIDAHVYLERRRARGFAPLLRRPRIAVVEVHGAIVEQAPLGLGAMCEASRVVRQLEFAGRAPGVCGVVLHVDSPGGGVLASEKIHRAVTRLAAKKPVVSCMAGVAASGGYYVSAGCHAIVARPTTITGSIGVVAARVLVAPLLERIGVRSEVVRRGRHADMMGVTRPLDDDERHVFEATLARAYERFVALVAEGRHKPVAEVLPVAGGRVWAGRDALEHGLVDRLGGLAEALDEVRARAGDRGARAEPFVLSPPRAPAAGLLQLLPRALNGVGPERLGEALVAFGGARERILAVLPVWPLP